MEGFQNPLWKFVLSWKGISEPSKGFIDKSLLKGKGGKKGAVFGGLSKYFFPVKTQSAHNKDDVATFSSGGKIQGGPRALRDQKALAMVKKCLFCL